MWQGSLQQGPATARRAHWLAKSVPQGLRVRVLHFTCRWFIECFTSETSGCTMSEALLARLRRVKVVCEESLVLAEGSAFYELVFTGENCNTIVYASIYTRSTMGRSTKAEPQPWDSMHGYALRACVCVCVCVCVYVHGSAGGGCAYPQADMRLISALLADLARGVLTRVVQGVHGLHANGVLTQFTLTQVSCTAACKRARSPGWHTIPNLAKR